MCLNRLLMISALSLAVTLPSYADETIANPATATTQAVVGKATEKTVIKAAKQAAEKTNSTVNINTADAKDIAKTLKGVGMKRAEAIVTYRTQNGPFKSIDDLTKIKGISKKVVEKNNGKITLN